MGVGLAAAGLVAWMMIQGESRRIDSELKRVSEAHRNIFNRKIEHATLMLQSVRTLFQHQNGLDRRDFSELAKQYLSREKGLKALQWVPLLEHRYRSEVERRSREEGLEDFQIHERNSNGESAAAAVAEFYMPILYCEPLQGNEAAIGLNLLVGQTYPVHERARTTGMLAVSPPVRLVQETGKQQGMIFIVPVYSKANPDTGASQYMGSLQAVFRVGDLVKRSILDGVFKGMEVSAQDITDPAEPMHLFGPLEPGPGFQDEITQRGEIAMGSRRIEFLYRPSHEWLQSHRSNAIWIITLCLIAFTGVLAFHVRSIGLQNRKIARLVELRTAQLEQEVAARVEAMERERHLEERLLEVQKLESLGLMASGVAHDFNNLLTGILGNASLAASALQDRGLVQSCVTNIEIISRRAADLCRSMLSYTGRNPADKKPLDFNRFVAETLDLLKLSISKKATLELSLENRPCRVSADASQLRQVVMNLVINASDALQDKTGTIQIRTRRLDSVNSKEDGAESPQVLLTVRDTGVGMDAPTVKKIFDPFFTTKSTGRGLGLSAVQGIVRSHDGEIHVHSTVGEGSTFEVQLPLLESSDEETPGAASGAAFSIPSGGTALVVDDEDSIRIVAAAALRRFGFVALECTNGREALEKFAQHEKEIRFAVVDMTMPVMDGPETIRRLRELVPTLPILITSGYHASAFEETYKGDPRMVFLQKPFDIMALQAALAELLS